MYQMFVGFHQYWPCQDEKGRPLLGSDVPRFGRSRSSHHDHPGTEKGRNIWEIVSKITIYVLVSDNENTGSEKDETFEK